MSESLYPRHSSATVSELVSALEQIAEWQCADCGERHPVDHAGVMEADTGLMFCCGCAAGWRVPRLDDRAEAPLG